MVARPQGPQVEAGAGFLCEPLPAAWVSSQHRGHTPGAHSRRELGGCLLPFKTWPWKSELRFRAATSLPDSRVGVDLSSAQWEEHPLPHCRGAVGTHCVVLFGVCSHLAAWRYVRVDCLHGGLQRQEARIDSSHPTALVLTVLHMPQARTAQQLQTAAPLNANLG